MHEIVTLQIGNQANYIGTHFWNIQESYFTYDDKQESPVDHDIHFQQGIAADGTDTFTPRTLIYDFKPEFGTLKRVNELYDVLDEGDEGTTHRSSTTHRQPSVPQHAYQRALNEGLDPPPLNADSIRFWSDYNRVFYHPKSIVQVYEDQLEPQQKSFAQWSDGEALFNTLNRQSDLLDDELRPFIEQCDQMQGLQVMAGVDNGWGGFTSKYLDAVRDEYDKSTLIVFGLCAGPPESIVRRSLWTANQAHSLFSLTSQASLYVPLTAASHNAPRSLERHHQHSWLTSATQSIGMESVLLASRLRSSPVRLTDVAAFLTQEPGQKVAEAHFKIRGAYRHELNGTVLGEDTAHTISQGSCQLSPSYHTDAEELEGAVQMTRGEQGPAASEVEAQNALLEMRCTMPFPLLDSFPSLAKGIRSIKVNAKLGKSTGVSKWTTDLQRIAARRTDIDEREELLDGLSQIKSAYEGDTGDSADSDD